MPDVSREEVKLLCIAIGIRKASQKLGLSEQRVRQWSSRGKWFAKSRQIEPGSGLSRYSVTTVTPSVSSLLQSELEENSQKTKIGLSRATKNAAATFERMKGSRVITHAQELRHVSAAASTVHGWETKNAGNSINLNVGIMLGGMQP